MYWVYRSLGTLRVPVSRNLFASYSRSYYSVNDEQWRATTILSIRKNDKVIVIGDGQVSRGSSIVKPNAKKVRRLDKGKVITGFAGSTADAVTILERLEAKLEEFPGQLRRACVAVAQDWRTNRAYSNLDAVMIVADKNETYLLSGNGDVLEPPSHGIIAIGSGGDFAASAAIALLETDWEPERIANKAMTIAADLCVYTNHNFIMESIESNTDEKKVIEVEGGSNSNETNNGTQDSDKLQESSA